MRKVINDQKNKLHALNSEKLNCSSNHEVHSVTLAHNLSQTLPLEPQPSNKMNTPTVSEKAAHNSHILIHESNGKSEGKKALQIDIATSKNSNKENIQFLNDHKRSNTPQSLHSSTILSKPDVKCKAQKKQADKPTINITMDSIKLRSPTLKIEAK
jgi:hypothetical protein